MLFSLSKLSNTPCSEVPACKTFPGNNPIFCAPHAQVGSGATTASIFHCHLSFFLVVNNKSASPGLTINLQAVGHLFQDAFGSTWWIFTNCSAKFSSTTTIYVHHPLPCPMLSQSCRFFPSSSEIFFSQGAKQSNIYSVANTGSIVIQQAKEADCTMFFGWSTPSLIAEIPLKFDKKEK